VKSKPVIPRNRAGRDIDEAIVYYLREAGRDAALGFVAALEKAFLHISEHPAAGSTRYTIELQLPGLRSWPVAQHPYLVFYVERDESIDVWRVLQSQRDLPAWLRDPTEHAP
jgi:toxin ParE1/3/4